MKHSVIIDFQSSNHLSIVHPSENSSEYLKNKIIVFEGEGFECIEFVNIYSEEYPYDGSIKSLYI